MGNAGYIFSGSFVAYLEREIGLPTLMKIYSAEDTSAAILRLTRKPVAQWKAEWRRKLHWRAAEAGGSDVRGQASLDGSV